MNSDVINEHYYGDPADPSTERARERIHWICKQAVGRDVLDIGCSQGIVCLILGREGFQCTGIDLESGSLAVGEQALAKEDEIVRQRVKLQLADATELPFANESFDTVILGEILEHLVHPDKVLMQVKRVLRPGGRVVVTVPFGLNAFPDHKRTYYPISLLELLQPLFRTATIGTLGNYITYSGTNDAAYDPVRLGKEALFDCYLPLERALEERCLAKELSLLDTASKLYAQIKALTAQAEEKEKKLNSAEEALGAKDKRGADLEAELGQLRAAQIELREALSRARAELDWHVAKAKEAQETLTGRDSRIRELELSLEQRFGALAELNERLLRSETASASHASKSAELQAALRESEDRAKSVQHELEQERTARAAASQRLAEAEGAAATQADRARSLQESSTAQQERLHRLETELQAERASISTLTQRIIRAEVAATTHSNEARELQELVRAREKRVSALETELEKDRATMTELGTRVVQTEAVSAVQQSRIKDLETSLAAKNRQLRSLEHALEKERATTETLRKDLVQAEANQTRFNAETARAAADVAALEQKLAALQTENAKYQQDFAARTAAAQQQLARAEALHQARLLDREKQHQEESARKDAEQKRRTVNQRVRETARLALPPEARVLVVTKGDDDLLRLEGRVGLHFPQTPAGVYAGYHPADSAQAISHLEEMKAKGAGFLLIPASSFWWLEFYADFRRHLEGQYRLLAYSEDCVIYALGAAPQTNRLLRFSFGAPTAVGPKPATETGTNGNGQAPAPVGAPVPAPAVTPAAAPAAKPAASGVETRVAPPASVPGLAEKPEAPGVAISVAETNRLNAVVAVPAAPTRPKTAQDKLTVGAVFDEFTAACFRPECNLVTFRPDNWKATLEANSIDLLFIESAWQGNGGSWQYKVASFQKPMGEELVDLIQYCRSRDIPTVFWNKEDPPHYHRFIHRAPLFDHVFTSDADMIPKYREALKHDRITALPFAAQPKVHNPIIEVDRPDTVCFAGAYYANDHTERRADMDHILRPALAFGLHIYDRQHGVAGANAQAYRFPDIYQSAIQGRLEYDQMIKAYKRYRVFLNVNSVKNSPTMFSRRVFELLASGTPVISSYSLGIRQMLGSDIVHLATTEADTLAHLERLLHDEHYWAATALKGVRVVAANHTYARRLTEICQKIALSTPGQRLLEIEAVAKVNTREQLERLVDTLARQKHRQFTLTLAVGKAVSETKIQALREALPDIQMRVLGRGTDLFAHLAATNGPQHLWLANPDHFYGEHFLLDAALTAVYADAEVIGKRTCYEAGRGGAKLRLKNPGQDFRFVNGVSPGSVLARAGKLNAEQWRGIAANKTVNFGNARVLSIDRFNYVAHAGGLGGARLNDAGQTLGEALV
jgi:SAM-dependent methyltransferase/spore maturation protein CgeB